MGKERYSCKKTGENQGMCKIYDESTPNKPLAWIKFAKNKDQSISVIDSDGTKKYLPELLSYADKIIRKGVREQSREDPMTQPNPGEFS